jgi:hypothetical protein
MPGDPKECREHALHCDRLAQEANTRAQAEVFRNLARQWLKLAIELERAHALLDERDAVANKR